MEGKKTPAGKQLRTMGTLKGKTLLGNAAGRGVDANTAGAARRCECSDEASLGPLCDVHSSWTSSCRKGAT